MIKILSGMQMRELDKKAIEELGIPSLILMENAGRAVFEEVNKIIYKSKQKHASVLVICGKGNNGGDGFVSARHFIENGYQTSVVCIYSKEELEGDALENFNILKNFSEVLFYEEIGYQNFKKLVTESDYVIDAVLGTGIKTEVKGKPKEVIEIINTYSEGKVVSVDIPSGINPDTSEIMGFSVLADYTVTFHLPKFCHYTQPAASYCGKVIVKPIGIPSFLTEEKTYNNFLLTKEYIKSVLPKRPKNSHKGLFGSVFNIAGCFEMPGAAFMSAFSSLLVGAGYSILACPESIIPNINTIASELVYKPLKETQCKNISVSALNDVLEGIKKTETILLGPGISTHKSTVGFVSGFMQEVKNSDKKFIIDADGINCLSIASEKTLPENSVITPHPKELSRLLGVSLDEILKDKIKYAKYTSKLFKTITVLKGSNTIISMPDESIFINTTGNSGLASAGSGDVLAGMIAGFAAQGASLKDATLLGVYIHGYAADIAVQETSEYSLTASCLMNYINKAIKSLT